MPSGPSACQPSRSPPSRLPRGERSRGNHGPRHHKQGVAKRGRGGAGCYGTSRRPPSLCGGRPRRGARRHQRHPCRIPAARVPKITRSGDPTRRPGRSPGSERTESRHARSVSASAARVAGGRNNHVDKGALVARYGRNSRRDWPSPQRASAVNTATNELSTNVHAIRGRCRTGEGTGGHYRSKARVRAESVNHVRHR